MRYAGGDASYKGFQWPYDRVKVLVRLAGTNRTKVPFHQYLRWPVNSPNPFCRRRTERLSNSTGKNSGLTTAKRRCTSVSMCNTTCPRICEAVELTEISGVETWYRPCIQGARRRAASLVASRWRTLRHRSPAALAHANSPFTHLEITATRCSSFWLNANVPLFIG